MEKPSRKGSRASLFLRLPMLALVLSMVSHGAVAMEIEADPVPMPPPLRTQGDFSSSARDHLSSAFRAAIQRLHSRDSCRALFADLGGDGLTLLARSHYVLTKPNEESQVCRSRVAAFTGVGSPVTRLCRRFRRLNDRQAALILLHEALHFAGQTEAPHEPRAPTSQEINERVATSCDL